MVTQKWVKMSYDQLNDVFIVQSKAMGVTAKVQINDVPGNGNYMEGFRAGRSQ